MSDAADIYALTTGLLSGSAKTIYADYVDTNCATAKNTAVAATSNADKATERAKDAIEFITERIVKGAKKELLKGVIPNKIVAMVKRYLRREARKPADMKVRQY